MGGRGMSGNDAVLAAERLGLVEVTEGEFFAALKADPRNIHPRPERTMSVWEVVAFRTVFAITTPGYADHRGSDGKKNPERYFMRLATRNRE